MNNLPKIFGTCPAGCQWETIHRSEFEKSASLIKQHPQENGKWLLEIGKEYKIFAPKTEDGTAFDCNLNGFDNSREFETPCNDKFANSFIFKALGWDLPADGLNVFYYEYNSVRYAVVARFVSEYFPSCEVSGATEVYLYNADATIKAENGKSAYEIDVEKGFEGTEQEWLDRVVHGADGKTPYIKDGTWWIGDTDTGVKAEGTDGKDGTTQVVPLFANDTSECTDTSKLYVLPDGYIYGYIKTLPQVTYETHENAQWNGSAQLSSVSGIQAKNTNNIPVREGDQFIYTGNGKWNASVYWLKSPITNQTSNNNTLIVSKETFGADGAPATVTVTAPAGANYVMFVSWGSGSAVLEVTPLTGSYQWASTGHAFVPADYEDRIIALENKSSDSILAGKKIVYDGDSIAESRNGTSANNGGGYAKIIADLVGGTYVNQAVGGAYLRSTTIAGKHSVVNNLTNLPTDADLYCFEGGINDYWNKATLGTYSKTDFTGTLDATTVCGALETIFRYALNNFVGKPICFVITHKIQSTAYEKNQSGGNTFEEYHNAMVGICEKYSIPYYDAFSESGLNGWNTVQNNAYLNANANGTADGTHPNEEGYKRYYVPQLIALFEKIMPR